MNRLLLGAVAAFVAVAAQGPVAAAPIDDKTFVATAMGINLEEIQLGQLAQMKSMNAAVKAYGQTLVKDHTDANNQAKTVAMKIGVTVPTALSADAQKAMTDLMGRNGTDFDNAFLAHMVMGHTMAISLFNDQSMSSNADVANFAKMNLPGLKMHLTTAQMLQMTKGNT